MKNKELNEKWENILNNIKKSTPPISFDTWFKPIIVKSIDNTNHFINLEVYNPLIIKVIENRYMSLLQDKIYEEFGYTLKPLFNVHKEGEEEKKYESHSDEVILNPTFTFENFIVGDNNKYAHAAALAVAQSPASGENNPLYIYGNSGLGKTHLMNAIGIQIMKDFPEKKILYVSAETFTNDFINSIRDNKTNDFKNRYRYQDVLLIDDVQFIEGKGKSEEEFFHTFEALYNSNKQIVLSSDRPPSKMTKIDERLKTRFGWKLVADIQPPDKETRKAILQAKLKLEHLELNDDFKEIIEYISDRVTTNVRELEGDLNRVIGFSRMEKKAPTLDYAKVILKELEEESSREITPEKIIDVICSEFSLKKSDIVSSSRKRTIAYPRQIAMYLCRELTDLSYPKISEYFGGRDHSTIMHGYEKISESMDIDDQTKKTIENIIEKVKA